MIIILVLLASLLLGLSLMAVGGYLWLAAKKMIAGIVLLTVGLLLTGVPIVLFAYFMITRSVS